MGREGRITPRDFRQGIIPKKRELRQDGMVSRREGRILQERRKRSRDSGEPRHRQQPLHDPPFPVVDLTEDEEDDKPIVADRQRALDALQATGARYQRLLDRFAHEYGSEEDEKEQGKQKKPRVLNVKGELPRDESGVRQPGFPVAAPQQPCFARRPLAPPAGGDLEPLVIDEDYNAVQVQRSGSMEREDRDPQAPQSPPPVPPPNRPFVRLDPLSGRICHAARAKAGTNAWPHARSTSSTASKASWTGGSAASRLEASSQGSTTGRAPRKRRDAGIRLPLHPETPIEEGTSRALRRCSRCRGLIQRSLAAHGWIRFQVRTWKGSLLKRKEEDAYKCCRPLKKKRNNHARNKNRDNRVMKLTESCKRKRVLFILDSELKDTIPEK